MKKYVITICILLGLLLSCFACYFVYSKYENTTTTETLKSKVDEEIKYLDNNIIKIINSFNNITYTNYKIVEQKVPSSDSSSSEDSKSSGGGGSGGSGSSSGGQSGSSSGEEDNTITSISIASNGILTNKDNKVDWKQIKEEIEKMYGAWTTILIDLNALNVDNNQLLKFNNILDNLTQALEKEDKKISISRLAELYSLLPLYVKDYSNDRNMISIYNTKSNILFAYALMEYDNKDREVKDYITKAKKEFSYIVNNPVENSKSMSTINKAYVELNEMEKDNSIKERKIFYIHYKNLLQELSVIY